MTGSATLAKRGICPSEKPSATPLTAPSTKPQNAASMVVAKLDKVFRQWTIPPNVSQCRSGG